MKPTSSDIGHYKLQVSNGHKEPTYGESREQSLSNTSLVQPSPADVCFQIAGKKPTSKAKPHGGVGLCDEAPNQSTYLSNNPVGPPTPAPAAPLPQDVRYGKAQYEDIRKELEGVRSQLQNLVEKEKDRELVTKACSTRCNEFVEREVTARRAVIAMKKETDRTGSELDRIIEEKDREKAINVDLEEKLKLAQEGLQVEEREERVRAAET